MKMVWVADDSYEGDLSQLMIQNNSAQLGMPIFECGNSTFCRDEVLTRGTTNFVVFVMVPKAGGPFVVGLATRMTYGDYNITNYVTIGIGCATALICLVLMIHSMIQTSKRIKQIRKRKMKM